MIRYARLSTDTGKPFAPMTYDRFRPYLDGRSSSDQIVAVGAYNFLTPAALAVATLNQDGTHAQLASLLTSPKQRGQNVGTGLLAELEAMLAAQGCKQITASYMGERPDLERVLAKRDWAVPEVIGIAYALTAEKIKESIFVQTPPEVPPDYTFFPWRDLTQEDRAAIAAREAQPGGWYSADAAQAGTTSPFINEIFFDLECSLGVRCQGEVIGWMLVSRVDSVEAHFNTLFVSPDHRGYHLGVGLVMRVVRYAVYNGYDRVRFQTMRTNAPMHSMIDGYIAAFSERHDPEKYTFKPLG
jgi:ribosomal protein S18 acetylase RimI-like enzyme